jgi:NAD(P)-dependent dehydrogenase (short-subunit alcohol dehydrogenase family)
VKMGLEGKVVLITGGSKGLGLACAHAFAGEGAKVAIASRSQDNLDRAREALSKEGFQVAAIRADLTQAQDAGAMVAAAERELGPVDVLINSAGAAQRHTMDEYDEAAWRQGMNAKYFPYVNAMDAVRPGMIKRGRGAIVNIIGMGGKVATPTHLAGGAANAALMLVTTGLAHALGRNGIRVNTINPGATFTDRVKQSLRVEAKTQGISEEETLKRNQARIPLGRYGRPEEVAAVAVFLASEQASYVTGAIIPMDGALVPVI